MTMIRETLEKLISSGLTETKIVSLLREKGIFTTQPTINRIGYALLRNNLVLDCLIRCSVLNLISSSLHHPCKLVA